MSKEAMKLALEALAVKFSEGWHEGIKIDASDIMLLNDAAQALAEQPARCAPAEDGVCESLDCPNHKPAQRTWVGLTLEDMETTHWSPDFRAGAKWAAAKLKEKNT